MATLAWQQIEIQRVGWAITADASEVREEALKGLSDPPTLSSLSARTRARGFKSWLTG